jgi:hypothetical protein
LSHYIFSLAFFRYWYFRHTIDDIFITIDIFLHYCHWLLRRHFTTFRLFSPPFWLDIDISDAHYAIFITPHYWHFHWHFAIDINISFHFLSFHYLFSPLRFSLLAPFSFSPLPWLAFAIATFSFHYAFTLIIFAFSRFHYAWFWDIYSISWDTYYYYYIIVADIATDDAEFFYY